MRNGDKLEKGIEFMNIELLIEHNGKLYSPVVEEGITWATERKGCPSELQFNVLKDDVLDFTEGDAVRLKVDNKEVFYGFVFKKKRDKNHLISVTAYDQLRYLKNQDTYGRENATATEVIKELLNDHFESKDGNGKVVLNIGELEDTKFKIASIAEEATALFDIILGVLDATLQNTGEMFVLYDDFGKITLKNIANMKLDVLIDEETSENFDYTSSIDDNTYNRIKLMYKNEKTGKWDVYEAQSGENINNWGVLQYCETLNEGENGQAKADALLDLYNHKTRNLSINNAFGDVRVRAGCLLPVVLDLGDVKIQNMMLVEKCKHEFSENQHLMNLTLRGGDFVA